MKSQELKSATLVHRPMRAVVVFGISLLLVSCGGAINRYEGLSLIEGGHLEEGLAKLEKARKESPQDVVLQREYLLQRDLLVKRMLNTAATERSAEHFDNAESQLRRVLVLDPNNPAAIQSLALLDADRRHQILLADAQAAFRKGDIEGAKSALRPLLVEDPNHFRGNQLRYQIEELGLKESIDGPTLNIKGRKPVTLQFKDSNLKMVLEAISRTTGVNIIVDKDVRNDIKVTLFIKDTPVEETLDLILFQNQLEKRVMGDNTVFIYPMTSAKSKDYQELKVRRFSLTNADPKQVQSMLKTITKTKDIYLDEKTNAVIVRDTPQAIRLAERLVTSMDTAEPEVMLEVELLDVNRSRTIDLGINWPTSVNWAYLPPTGATGSIRELHAHTSDNIKMTAGTNFGVALKALETDGDTRVLATPRIRARNKEKAKVMVGSRTPVISSAATTTAGAASSVYNTNIQYLETGIKLEVEPTIYLDGDVAIKVNVEVSDLGDKYENTTTGTLAYATTTNNASTVLRLKDGETQLLAGLIRGFTSNAGNGKVPGLGDVPVIGRLFGIQSDAWQNREIVLAITPHIIRNNRPSEADLIEMWSGTEANLKYGTQSLKVPANAGLGGQAPAAAKPAALPAAPAAANRPVTPVAAGRNVALTLSGPQQARVGEKVTYSINAPAGTAMTSVNLGLGFDPAVLKATSVTEGSLINKTGQKSAFDGQVSGGSVNVDLKGEAGQPVDTGGTIATVEFDVVGPSLSSPVTIRGANVVGGDGSALSVLSAPLNISVQAE